MHHEKQNESENAAKKNKFNWLLHCLIETNEEKANKNYENFHCTFKFQLNFQFRSNICQDLWDCF